MASFYVIRGKDNGQHFAIRGATATIGREATNQIQLRDSEVSRKHAKVIRTDGANYEIVDNGSSNGTFVNSRRIESQLLKSGDRVQVGRTLLIFTGGPEPYSTRSAAAVDIVTENPQADLSQIRSSIEGHSAILPAEELLESAFDLVGSDTGLAQDEPSTATPNDWEVLYRVSQAINRTVDLNELLAQVLALIFQWIDCDRGCVLLNDEVTGQLRPVTDLDRQRASRQLDPESPSQTAAGPTGSSPSRRRLTISRTILDHVVTKQEGVLTRNAQDDARWRGSESVTNLGVHEAICVPMLGRYGLVGALYVDTSVSAGDFAERQVQSLFADQHLKLMLAIANQAALAIEDTQFYQAMVQSERLAVMGQTIANLSHHVKNILQGVSGGNYLVEQGLEQENLEIVKQGWATVERNQTRISDLVMDMLTFSKDREPVLETCDVAALVDEVTNLLANRARQADVSLEIRPTDHALMAACDREGIHRALLNVLSNAIDATANMPQAHILLEASIEQGLAQISVTDNGPGIPEADRAKLFTPFESTKGAKGTGLGLAVSQKILREHGGDISFTSEVNHGTTFTLHWPCEQSCEGPATMAPP